jgi:hypothetical protein
MNTVIQTDIIIRTLVGQLIELHGRERAAEVLVATCKGN